MRGLIQRVSEAWVTAAPDRDAPAEETGRIGTGVVALIGVTHDDDEADASKLADKIWNLRIFPDEDGDTNVSCADVGGEVLVISQFTLYADTRKGRRPSYLPASPPEHAEPLVEAVTTRLRDLGAQVATGRFRHHMQIGLVNDGPITILLEA